MSRVTTPFSLKTRAATDLKHVIGYAPKKPLAMSRIARSVRRSYENAQDKNNMSRINAPFSGFNLQMDVWTCDAHPWDRMNPSLEKFEKYPK